MGGGVSKNEAPTSQPQDERSVYLDENRPHWTAFIDKPNEIRFAKKGIASKEGVVPQTLLDFLEKANSLNKDKIVLRVERPLKALAKGEKPPPALKPEELTTWTFQQYVDDAKAVAAGMIACGFEQHDACCIFGFNCPEWFIGAFGAIYAAGCFTGIYPSDTAEQVKWKAQLSNSSIALAENESAVQKFAVNAEELTHLKAIVNWDVDFKGKADPIKRADGTQIQVLSFIELKELGKGSTSVVEERRKLVTPSSVADLIYTSGTTGNPKAVMITHDNLLFTASSVVQILRQGSSINFDMEHRILSYLPLSHIAGSLVDIIIQVVLPCRSSGFVQVTFARPYDLKAGSLGDRLKLVRPTLFLGVPRVWEKIQEKLLAVAATVKGIKRKVAKCAKGKALRYATEQQIGGTGKIPIGYPIAQKVILSKIKNALGLDKCVHGLSGAAPLKIETQKYFAALGINIFEAFGMSETTGVSTFTVPKSFLWGSVGFPIPGVETEIFSVDTDNINNKKLLPRAKDLFHPEPDSVGEICFRGRNIMAGYLCNPRLGDEHVAEIEKKNADCIDDEGWLHSGDKGCKDNRELVAIHGRYKELIITAGGENIAPVPIENAILARFSGISNIVMVGDKRKFNIALVTLKAEGATGEFPGTDDLDTSVLSISEAMTVTEARKDSTWIKLITEAIEGANSDGSVCPSNASKIQKFTILPSDFSVETGEFTATLKLKRSAVHDKHQNAIEAVYGSSDVYVPYPA